MTRRERLRRCYFHEELDRPGVYVRTGYPGNDPTYAQTKALMEAHTELKGSWHAGQLERGPTIEQRTEPGDADWDRRIRILHTPAGDLEAVTLVSRRNLPSMAQTHFLKDRGDAEKFLSLPAPTYGGTAETFFAADRAMGDRGIVEVELGANPGGTVAGLFGSETFAMMTVFERDIVHQLCQKILANRLNLLKHALSLGVGPYFKSHTQELIVPPLHGPVDFNDFNAKYDKPLFDEVHAAGGAVHVHCHARIGKVIQGFVDVGVDVLHPFEAPPMGDITAAQAKQVAGRRMCLEGNIQIADMYEKPPENIRQQVRDLIRDAFADRQGLIVCPTASPYLFGMGEQAFPQFKAMVETVLEYASGKAT